MVYWICGAVIFVCFVGLIVLDQVNKRKQEYKKREESLAKSKIDVPYGYLSGMSKSSWISADALACSLMNNGRAVMTSDLSFSLQRLIDEGLVEVQAVEHEGGLRSEFRLTQKGVAKRVMEFVV